MQIKRLVVFLIGILLCCSHLLFPKPTFAHTGGGPPFLLINGKYAQTNPYFLGGDQVPVSQDMSPELYLPNVPIHFEVDLSKLLVPPDIAQQSVFRWTWEQNGQTHDTGVKIDHTYTNIGSYLLTLEVKAPDVQDYVVLDTVQINVVPSLQYKLPTATIEMVANPLKTNIPVTFQVTTTHDPSTSIASTDWYADTDIMKQQSQIIRTYTDADFADYVFVKVYDSNGLSNDAAIQVAGDSGILQVSNLNPKTSNVPILSAQQAASLKPSSQKMMPIIAGIAAVLIIIVGGGTVLRLKRKH